jgi:hypothetical protein
VNPYGGGDGVWFYPGFWDFVGYVFSEHGIFFGRIDGRRFGVVCVVGIVGDVQYIFTRVPTF